MLVDTIKSFNIIFFAIKIRTIDKIIITSHVCVRQDCEPTGMLAILQILGIVWPLINAGRRPFVVTFILKIVLIAGRRPCTDVHVLFGFFGAPVSRTGLHSRRPDTARLCSQHRGFFASPEKRA
jgi:hypothetical protein